MPVPERSWFTLREAPEEALRLLQDYRDAASPELMSTFALAYPRLQRRIREGRAHGLLWVGPKDDGIGFAIWSVVPSLGRQCFLLYLAEGYRNAATFSQLLRQIETDPSGQEKGPLVLVSEEVPGLPTEIAGKVFAERGFQRCSRPAMVRRTGPPWPPVPPLPPDVRLRPIDPEDRARAERVSALAFRDGLSRLWFEDGDPFRSSAATFRLLEKGEWGRWRREASWVYERSGQVLGVGLVTHAPHRCPLLLSLSVLPEEQGHGIGRALLVETLRSLHAKGEKELELNVVRENASAFALYTSLGFEVVKGTERGFWVRDPGPWSGGKPPGPGSAPGGGAAQGS